MINGVRESGEEAAGAHALMQAPTGTTSGACDTHGLLVL